MKNTLLVVADLACLKAYRLETEPGSDSLRLYLIDEINDRSAHTKLVDRVSDLAGRFPRSTGNGASGAMSDGERHNIQLELRKRRVRELARRINELARAPEFETCLLAASREIQHQLIAELDHGVRAKIARSVAADLTKTDRAELLNHF